MVASRSRSPEPRPPAIPLQVVVVEPERKHRSWLERVFRTVTPAVYSCESLGSTTELPPCELIAVNYEHLEPGQDEWLHRLNAAGDAASRPHVLVFCGDQRRYQQLFTAFARYGLTHLLAKDQKVDAVDLIVTTQKIARGDIFGIEKYFTWGVESVSLPVRDSSQKRDIVAAASDYAELLDVNPHLSAMFAIVVEEFAVNALYDAPRDSHGRPRYAHLPRSEAVNLGEGEEIKVTFCCDGRTLGVAISDPFGSLTKDELLACMSRCFSSGGEAVRPGPGGAGVGLYFSFECLSHFVINVCPGQRTEVIGLIDVSGGLKNFSSRGKSFNVFWDEGR
jgi:hypothetical protein